jgi:glucokinase
MNNKCFLLLDVGGTFVKSVVATLDGELLPNTETSVPINSDGTRLEIEKSFATVVNHGATIADYNGYTLAGVGIAFPGPFDYNTGVSYMTHKFAALEKLSVKDFFHSLPEIGADMPVVFMHDVTAAVLGEMRFGAAQGYKNTAVITLGTGLGFAHTIDGEIQYAPMGSPLVSIYNRPYRDGVLEDYVSKRGFLRAYAEVRGEENPSNLTVAMIGGMCGQADEQALATFKNVGKILADEIKPMLEEYQIECLLFGGQISRSFCYMESVFSKLKDEVASLQHVSTMKNLSTAAPLGLLSKLREELGC